MMKRRSIGSYIKMQSASAFLFNDLNINRRTASAFPMLYHVSVMKEFLDKFSLSLILRQFFCGIVFFVPSMLAFSHGCTIIDKISGLTTDVLLPIAIASLIVGTIIYHIEKNTYSYFVQCFFLCIHKATGRCHWLKFIFIFLCYAMAILAGVASPIAFVNGVWEVLLWLILMASVFAIILAPGIIPFYQKVWSIDDDAQENNRTIKTLRIMNHLDTWSDNIHCVQCCCFAWLLGIGMVNGIVMHSGFGLCCCQCGIADEIIHQSLGSAFASFDCLCVYALLLLELVFEFHRFSHLYKITEGK